MKRNYRAFLRKSLLWFGATISFAVIAIVTFKVVAAPKPEHATTPMRSTNESSSLVSPISPPTQNLEAEVITISPTGFQPEQITRPSGRFLLAVENRSGLQRIDFQLQAQSGTRVLQVSRSWERSDWSDVVNPPAGTYVLTEANHPSWRCVITITQ